LFVSMVFPVFLGIVVALFFALPVKWRPAFLLAASYAVCGWLDWRSLLVLVVISFSTWAAGSKIEKSGKEVCRGKNQRSGIGKYTAVMGNNNINISDMTNKSRGDYAYSLLDIDSPVTEAAVEQLKGIEGVLKVRIIK